MTQVVFKLFQLERSLTAVLLPETWEKNGSLSAIDMRIFFYSHVNKTHFDKKGLKVRAFGTPKWPF